MAKRLLDKESFILNFEWKALKIKRNFKKDLPTAGSKCRREGSDL
jgi:hypothetical protein